MVIPKEIKKILTEVGLDNKESAIFFALMKRGSLSARSIADDTGITRTYVYDITEDLLKKGLITGSEIRGVKHYDALGYQDLVGYVAKKKDELNFLEKELHEAAGVFKKIESGSIQKTKVRFYEGLNGIKSVYEEIRNDLEQTKGRKELVTYWPTESLEKAYPNFFEKQVYFDMPALIKRDIMYECATTYKYIQAYRESPTTHTYKIWPKEKGEFPTDVEVWGNKVAFTDVRGTPSGIVIENESVADSMRMWFERVWESLPQSH